MCTAKCAIAIYIAIHGYTFIDLLPYMYSEIVVDPSYEELEISDGMAHIISNRFTQLNNIKIEGKDESI